MLSCLAHGLWCDLEAPRFQAPARQCQHRNYATSVGIKSDAVEVTDLLHCAGLGRELFEHSHPEVFRESDHADGSR